MNVVNLVQRSRDGAVVNDAELLDAAIRESIYATIHPKPTCVDGPLLRQLLPIEMRFRAHDSASSDDDDYFENLYWCALLLYQLNDLRDVLPMWRAKHVNFDTGCAFDIQFLVSAGVDATLKYLSDVEDPDAVAAIDYIQKCRDAGDFDELDEWLTDRIAYFDPELA